jgi:prevent-host-death family protein
MVHTVSATEARDKFAEIINRVMYAGDEYIVERQGQPAIKITIAPKTKKPKKKKITGNEFLQRLAQYKMRGGPRDLAKNHDKYTWE